MPLDPALLEKLACPKCLGPVDVMPADAGLACRACDLRFALVDGDIPDMILEHATPLSAPAAPRS